MTTFTFRRLTSGALLLLGLVAGLQSTSSAATQPQTSSPCVYKALWLPLASAAQNLVRAAPTLSARVAGQRQQRLDDRVVATFTVDELNSAPNSAVRETLDLALGAAISGAAARESGNHAEAVTEQNRALTEIRKLMTQVQGMCPQTAPRLTPVSCGAFKAGILPIADDVAAIINDAPGLTVATVSARRARIHGAIVTLAQRDGRPNVYVDIANAASQAVLQVQGAISARGYKHMTDYRSGIRRAWGQVDLLNARIALLCTGVSPKPTPIPLYSIGAGPGTISSGGAIGFGKPVQLVSGGMASSQPPDMPAHWRLQWEYDCSFVDSRRFLVTVTKPGGKPIIGVVLRREGQLRGRGSVTSNFGGHVWVMVTTWCDYSYIVSKA